MGGFSIWHWIVVLVIVLLIFGTKRLRGAGKDLGDAVRGFKEGMKGDEPPAQLKDQSRDGSESSTNKEHDRNAQ